MLFVYFKLIWARCPGWVFWSKFASRQPSSSALAPSLLTFLLWLFYIFIFYLILKPFSKNLFNGKWIVYMLDIILTLLLTNTIWLNTLWKFLSCNVVILRVRMATKRTVAKEIGIPRNQEFTKNIFKKTNDQSSLHFIMWKYCSGCKD